MQLNQLKELGFQLPEEKGATGSGQSGTMEPGGTEPRPVANLAFFEGVGSMAIVLRRLKCEVVAHLSWETDVVTKDFLASRFPRAIPMGDARKTTVTKIKETLEEENIPAETLVIISGGPPCVDHSRIKQKKAPGARGKEGRKLAEFANLVVEIKRKLPWECRFLVDHVVPGSKRMVEPIES